MFPFMAMPPFSILLEKFLDWFINLIANELEKQAFFLYTDFRTSAQGKAYVEAKLKGFKAEMSGNLEELKRATEEIKNTFRTFAKFNT